MASNLADKISNTFSDIDLDFIPHPVSGDISVLKNADAIKRSIRNILYTGLYERPFNENFGGNLKQLLFEPTTPLTELSIKTYIQDSINFYEPRVSIVELNVVLNPDELGYNVYLLFTIDNISQVSTLELFLERVR